MAGLSRCNEGAKAMGVTHQDQEQGKFHAPVRYREPRKSAVPGRIQLLFSDQMVVSQPSLVYDMGSNKSRITDKTAANQV